MHCEKVLELVDSDVLGVETEHFIDASQSSKSTVGIMVKDGLVTNLLVGGVFPHLYLWPSVSYSILVLVIASLPISRALARHAQRHSVMLT